MAGSERAGGGHEVWVAAAGDRAGAAATAVIRLMGMLPEGWICEQRVEGGRIALRVVPAAGGTAEAVERWLAGALADRALTGWRAVPPGA
ncbi:hypothetical protein P3T27_002541 [Kitasatospora sp. MAA19]|uniref:hypothetical protein n=1 Tax=unclassified Kitasatospora TaxID=2633591 RepID=UPI00247663AF|nr:hypothetical protein [Kitasatospora sp. MAA19]MDH6705819.1 hypothetical protein [Kitasatospora sp. MAA19]